MKLLFALALAALAAASASASDEICKRANDASFTPTQRHLIEQARKHLESLHKRPLDACYDVRPQPNGTTFVMIEHVVGYRDGKPYFHIGGHSGVEFDKAGKLIRVHGGA